MHYLGNASISNYRCTYGTPYIVGAALIAVAASTTALAVFFVFESTWKNAWWRRILCAAVLAGAVSGMHWCAAVGTDYILLELSSQTGGMSRETTIIIVIVLAVAACLAMGASALYSLWIRRSYASKAQQVVLASAFFDKRGRILVNKEGLLPTEVVTDSLILQSNDDLFDTNHPLFHWAYRASRNWNSIANLIECMAHHIASLVRVKGSDRTNFRLIEDDGNPIDDYNTVCCELFSLAASALASKLRMNLLDIGELWDEILVTGRTFMGATSSEASSSPRSSRQVTSAKHASKLVDSSEDLAEKGLPVELQYGRGSLMVLVKHIRSRHTVEQLESVGYRFAELDQVVAIMRSSMQIKTPDLGMRLRQMSAVSEQDTKLTPGVHVGVFGIRARVDHRGFDVLVRRNARHMLPSAPLPMERLESRHITYLNHMQNQSMATVVERLTTMVSRSADMTKFAACLLEAIRELRETFEDGNLFDDAVLMQQVIRVPYSSGDGDSVSLTCSLIAFQLVLPIHSVAHVPKCTFIPLRFFKVRQMAMEGSPHHLDFSHAVHREMSSVLKETPGKSFLKVFKSNRANSPDLPDLTNMDTKRSFMKHISSKSWSDKVNIGRGRRESRPKKERSNSQARLSPVASNYSGSVTQHSDFGGDEYRKDSLTTSSGQRSTDVELSPMNTPPLPQQQSLKQQFGGIMVSQEVVVDVETSDAPSPPPKYATGRRTSTVLATNSNGSGSGVGDNADGPAEMDGISPKQSVTKSNSSGGAGAGAGGAPEGFTTLRHAAGAFNAQSDSEGLMFVDEMLSLSMGKRVVI